jgi:hypothetical protein
MINVLAGPRRWAVTAALALAAAGLAGCGAPGPAHAGGTPTPTGPKPPPLATHEANLFRVQGPRCPCPYTDVSLRLSDGTTVALTVGYSFITRTGGRLTGSFQFTAPGLAPPRRYSFSLSQGQSRVIGGKYRFQVLRLWSMPDPLNNAADVRITPLT